MTRTQILNGLISKHSLRRYLEIGLSQSVNFDRVICEYKVSVDPDPKCHATYQMTSDEFFRFAEFGAVSGDNPGESKFDIVFIDGLHEAPQVKRDIENTLKLLTHDGFIVVHDCNPKLEIEQRVPRVTRRWLGDVWKTIVRLRHERNQDLSIVTVDTDEGCAIISRHGKKYQFRLTRELTWDNLQHHREDWLNLISIEKFKQKYL